MTTTKTEKLRRAPFMGHFNKQVDKYENFHNQKTLCRFIPALVHVKPFSIPWEDHFTF